jgi:hypothetical protein
MANDDQAERAAEDAMAAGPGAATDGPEDSGDGDQIRIFGDGTSDDDADINQI